MKLEEKPFENIVGKGNMLVTCIFSFYNKFFQAIKDRNHSENAWNSVKYNNVLFVKDLGLTQVNREEFLDQIKQTKPKALLLDFATKLHML